MDEKILENIPPMLVGKELIDALGVEPIYEKEIKVQSPADRLIALNTIYDFYMPSNMSQEIYTSGTISHLLYLFYTAQEISILNGTEVIDLASLDEAYQRMRMLHSHIEPMMSVKSRPFKRKKEKIIENVSDVQAARESSMEIYVVQDNNEEWSFEELASISKKKNTDILMLLKGKVSITEIS